MGSEGSSSSSSSSDAAANVNEYIQDKKIVSCCIGLSQLNSENLTGVVGTIVGGKNYVHSALWLSDKDFENTNEKGLIIEYGNYKKEFETKFVIDNDGNKVIEKIEKKYVIYHYNEKGGLRYYVKNYEDFKKIFATTAYVDLDVDPDNQVMFKDFIKNCAPFEKNEWIQEKYHFLKNNCQHFTAHALKVLKPNYRPKDIQITDKRNAGLKKESILPQCILNALKNK